MQKIYSTALFMLMLLLLTGCKPKNMTQASAIEEGQTGGYPITMRHAFGTTIIEKKPERIAALAWANRDTPLALGIAPVGVSEANYGKLTDAGIHPWTEAAFRELGVTPLVFKDSMGWDYEAISDCRPDLILAAYSGLTRKEYDMLSQIAPVAAYPDKPWQTLWREQVVINAEAMGMESEGRDLVERTEALIAEKSAAYPALYGKTAAFFWISPDNFSTFYAYLPSDPRAAYLTDLGLAFPESLRTLSAGSSEFSFTVSREHADLLSDIDIIVSYGDPALTEAMQADSLLSSIPAVKNGAIVWIAPDSELAGASTPSILSIPATIDEYLEHLNNAALKAEGAI